jgi:hypothetical protein
LRLALLLDEQISPEVARRIRAAKPAIVIHSIYEWMDGALCGVDDQFVLQAAARHRLTLVTFDLKTVPPVLVEWGSLGISHGGVVFVDDKTIRASDIGGLVRAILSLWDAEHNTAWTDRVVFLQASGRL